MVSYIAVQNSSRPDLDRDKDVQDLKRCSHSGKEIASDGGACMIVNERSEHHAEGPNHWALRLGQRGCRSMSNTLLQRLPSHVSNFSGAQPLLSTNRRAGSEVPTEQEAKWKALRESHMVDELLDAVAGAQILVLICGVSHMGVFVHTLQSKFACVEQCDVTKLEWFDQTLL
jgi:hypothetical protein